MKLIKNEMNYQLIVALIKNLRDKKLLTEEEFQHAQCILLEKYNPYIAELLYSNDLTN